MESAYLILRRERMLGIKPPEEKKLPKPIPKKSEKMKAEFKKYLPEMKKFLAKPENRECQIKMKGCTAKATCVHHAAGRTGHKLHDQDDWVASCSSCNLTVETDDLIARAKGV